MLPGATNDGNDACLIAYGADGDVPAFVAFNLVFAPGIGHCRDVMPFINNAGKRYRVTRLIVNHRSADE